MMLKLIQVLGTCFYSLFSGDCQSTVDNMYARKKARGRLDTHVNGLCVCAHEVPLDVGYGVGREESPSWVKCWTIVFQFYFCVQDYKHSIEDSYSFMMLWNTFCQTRTAELILFSWLYTWFITFGYLHNSTWVSSCPPAQTPADIVMYVLSILSEMFCVCLCWEKRMSPLAPSTLPDLI